MQQEIMQQEVTLSHETPNQLPVINDDAFLSDLNRSILSGTITIEYMNQLLDIKKRILDEKKLDAFNDAMAQMQPEIPIIGKDKETDKSKYASYEAIMEVVAPIMGRHGFSLSFKMDQSEGKVTIHGKLSHRAGHYEVVSIPLPLDTSGNKNAVQSMGSTLSYGKRYCASMLLNLSTKDEDDNGKASSKLFITEDRILKIEEWISACGDDSRAPFLKYMKVARVDDIAETDYVKAITFLKQRHGVK